MSERTIYLGHTAEKHHVWAHIEVEHIDHPITLTDHTKADGIDRISISWTVATTKPQTIEGMSTQRFDRSIIAGGQVAPEERVITSPAMPQETIDLIENAWSTQHLNDLHAECDHMVEGVDYTMPPLDTLPQQYGRPDITDWKIANVVCAVTGYRWGSAWLTKHPDPEILAGLRALL